MRIGIGIKRGEGEVHEDLSSRSLSQQTEEF